MSCNRRLVLRCRRRGRHLWALRTCHLKATALKGTSMGLKYFSHICFPTHAFARSPASPFLTEYTYGPICTTHTVKPTLASFCSIQSHPNYTGGRILETYESKYV
jgi:hypothetical protein